MPLRINLPLPQARTLRLKLLSELPQRVQQRLRKTSKLETPEEDRWAKQLELSISPRLSLVDEEDASLITGAEREFLERQDNGDDREPGPDDSATTD